ncbi:MAG: glycosyl transferase family 1 [Nitrospirales bacterium]|nr:MAG: glycosyl transferase family 1 [Nitrospirales bacterium]
MIARLNVGGPAKQALFLTQRLNDTFFQSTLITGVVSDDEAEMTFPYPDLERHVHVLPTLGREISWLQDIRTFVELCKMLKAIQPDIVHTHTAKAGTLGRLAAMWVRVPITVHTFHGHVFREYFAPFKTWLFVCIEKLLSHATDRIVVLSESQRRELSDEFQVASPQKLHVIPLGFNLSPFLSESGPAEVRTELGIGPSAFVLGFVGRLVPIKNPFLLLEAYCLATQSQQTTRATSEASSEAWHVIIAGGGELRDSLASTVQAKQLSHRIHFCGWQQRVAHIYAAMNVVVLTSCNEGTPVALIEAMASGKPFIATTVGGVIDLMVGAGQTMYSDNGGVFTLYQNGILVKSQDAVGLAGALRYVRNHPKESTVMGRVGREFAVKSFDEQRLLGDMRQLYQDLLAEKGMH